MMRKEQMDVIVRGFLNECNSSSDDRLRSIYAFEINPGEHVYVIYNGSIGVPTTTFGVCLILPGTGSVDWLNGGTIPLSEVQYAGNNWVVGGIQINPQVATPERLLIQLRTTAFLLLAKQSAEISPKVSAAQIKYLYRRLHRKVEAFLTA